MRTGRVSSREADRATFSAVATKASVGSEIAVSGSGSGKGGKSSARSVRIWKVALPDVIATSCSAAREFERRRRSGQRTNHVEQKTGWENNDDVAPDLCLQWDPETYVHLGRPESSR